MNTEIIPEQYEIVHVDQKLAHSLANLGDPVGKAIVKLKEDGKDVVFIDAVPDELVNLSAGRQGKPLPSPDTRIIIGGGIGSMCVMERAKAWGEAGYKVLIDPRITLQ